MYETGFPVPTAARPSLQGSMTQYVEQWEQKYKKEMKRVKSNPLILHKMQAERQNALRLCYSRSRLSLVTALATSVSR